MSEQKYLTVKKIKLEEKFNEFSIDSELGEFKSKQIAIKQNYYDELKDTKAHDHLFRDTPAPATPAVLPGSTPTEIANGKAKESKKARKDIAKTSSSETKITGNGARFYDKYRKSVSGLAVAELEILDVARSISTDSMLSMLRGRKKVQGITDWQDEDSFVRNHVKKQIAQGAKLPPEFAINLFLKRVWQTTKWGPLFPITAFINLYILPPKFFEWMANRKEQKQTLKALRKTEQTNRLIQSNIKDWKHIEKNQFRYIDVGDGRVLSVIKCKDEAKLILSVPPQRPNTEDANAGEETPAEVNAEPNASVKEASTPAAAPDPPPAALAAVKRSKKSPVLSDAPKRNIAKRDITEDELDRIFAEVKDAKK